MPFAAALNVLTLAIGLACFLCAYAFVAYLERAERGFANADRIYVLTTSFSLASRNFARENVTETPEAAAEFLALDVPELERVARALPIDGLTSISTGDRALQLAAVAADPAFLDIFALPFDAGDPRSALSEPRSVVLTRAAAARLFGAQSALGRSLRIANDIEATVTGVVGPVPEPSHIGHTAAAPLKFDMLVTTDVRTAIQETVLEPGVAESIRESWTGGAAITYLLLSEGAAPHEIENDLGEFVVRRVPEGQRDGVEIGFGLLPVRHFLRTSLDAELFSGDVGVSMSSVLLGMGVLVLVVACVNYANLATARGVRRLREVGLRKALGATPAEIALQHMLEAGALTAVALVVALAALHAVLPVLETISGMSLRSVLVDGMNVWIFAAGLGVVATLAAGAYPALVLARVKPIVGLRTSRTGLGSKKLSILLVGAQFAAASWLVIAVTITTMQNRKLIETGLGAVTDPVVLIENESRTTDVSARTLREELARLPQVRGVAAAGGLPWQRLVAVTFLRGTPDDSAPVRRVLVRSVDYDFFRVLDIPLVAGRVFDPARGEDARPVIPIGRGTDPAAGPSSIVVDRAFVDQFGFGSPDNAIGGIVYRPGAGDAAAAPHQIIGVVENRRLTFRGGGAEAVSYGLAPEANVTYVRIAASEVAAALESIDTVWSRLAPNVAISRRFFDDAFNQAYERFLRLSQICGALSLMALAIAATGLIGMAGIEAGRRRGEIGVRKALGASSAEMVGLLLRTFVKPIVVANAVVWPLAYFAARAYLAAFLDPIALDAWPFVLALAATLGIAVLAMAAQVLRAARLKPADVLRED